MIPQESISTSKLLKLAFSYISCSACTDLQHASFDIPNASRGRVEKDQHRGLGAETNWPDPVQRSTCIRYLHTVGRYLPF